MRHPTSLSILASKPRCIKQDHQGSNKDWAPSQQYEQRKWFLPEQVMEASHLSPEGMQEGSFEAQILTSISFTSSFILFLPWPKNGFFVTLLLCFGKELLFYFLSCLVRGLSSGSCPFQDLWFALALSASFSLFMASFGDYYLSWPISV
jgi:hypothetical protein